MAWFSVNKEVSKCNAHIVYLTLLNAPALQFMKYNIVKSCTQIDKLCSLHLLILCVTLLYQSMVYIVVSKLLSTFTELKNVFVHGLVKFVPADAYHFCRNLTATYSKPRTKKFSRLCTSGE